MSVAATSYPCSRNSLTTAFPASPFAPVTQIRCLITNLFCCRPSRLILADRDNPVQMLGSDPCQRPPLMRLPRSALGLGDTQRRPDSRSGVGDADLSGTHHTISASHSRCDRVSDGSLPRGAVPVQQGP